MSPVGGPPEGGSPEDRPGSLQPTSALTLVGWAVVGVVVGWALHPIAIRLGFVPPLVGIGQPVALLLLAALLGVAAWATRRVGGALPAHQAMNRFILARASALVAALIAGGYVGYAASWIGSSAQQSDDRLVASLAAAGCSLAATVAAVLLERACRVRDGDGMSPL